jgi:hypothetical protein
MANSVNDLFIEAQSAVAQNDLQKGARLLLQVLRIERNHEASWGILYRHFGKEKTYSEFQRDVTAKYFPVVTSPPPSIPKPTTPLQPPVQAMSIASTPRIELAHPSRRELACPICGNQSDQISSVASIVGRNIRHTRQAENLDATTYSTEDADIYKKQGVLFDRRVGGVSTSGESHTTGFRTAHTINSTEVADQLAMPAPPIQPEMKDPQNLISVFIIISMVITLISLFAVGGTSGWYWLLGIVIVAILAWPAAIIAFILYAVFSGNGVTALLIGGTTIGISFIINYAIKSNSKNTNQQEYDSQMKIYEKIMREYRIRKQKWGTAYYCDKDGVVFFPGEDVAIDLNNFRDYLFDNY